jgi:hypothetical protein
MIRASISIVTITATTAVMPPPSIASWMCHCTRRSGGRSSSQAFLAEGEVALALQQGAVQPHPFPGVDGTLLVGAVPEAAPQLAEERGDRVVLGRVGGAPPRATRPDQDLAEIAALHRDGDIRMMLVTQHEGGRDLPAAEGGPLTEGGVRAGPQDRLVRGG